MSREALHELVDLGTAGEVLGGSVYRHSCPLECPRAADLAGPAFHCRARFSVRPLGRLLSRQAGSSASNGHRQFSRRPPNIELSRDDIGDQAVPVLLKTSDLVVCAFNVPNGYV